MPTKEELIAKLTDSQRSGSFTVRELDQLMAKCGCEKRTAGRGSGVKYYSSMGRILAFDLPHPQKELKRYHIKAILTFLKAIGETED